MKATGCILILTCIAWTLTKHLMPVDFCTYYQVGNGQYGNIPYPWLYAHYLGHLWDWCRLWSFHTDMWMWATVNSLCALLLARKILNYDKAGLALLAAMLKPISLAITCGNCQCILALAICTPLGAVLSGAVKPYLFAFLPLHFWNDRRKNNPPPPNLCTPQGRRYLYSPDSHYDRA